MKILQISIWQLGLKTDQPTAFAQLLASADSIFVTLAFWKFPVLQYPEFYIHFSSGCEGHDWSSHSICNLIDY